MSAHEPTRTDTMAKKKGRPCSKSAYEKHSCVPKGKERRRSTKSFNFPKYLAKAKNILSHSQQQQRTNKRIILCMSSLFFFLPFLSHFSFFIFIFAFLCNHALNVPDLAVPCSRKSGSYLEMCVCVRLCVFVYVYLYTSADAAALYRI